MASGGFRFGFMGGDTKTDEEEHVVVVREAKEWYFQPPTLVRPISTTASSTGLGICIMGLARA